MAEDPSVEEPSQQVISVFCKVGKKVVRARWTVGGTMQDLQQLFRTHFTKEIGTHAKIPPIYIFHRATNQQYELEDLSDIYQYAVLEIKDATFGRRMFPKVVIELLPLTRRRGGEDRQSNWIWNVWAAHSARKTHFGHGRSSCPWQVIYRIACFSLSKLDWCGNACF